MFEEKRAMFIYTVAPVHMGSGTAIGAIDNPIQREVHTGHPIMVGSGLKGALRHSCSLPDDEIQRIFGPEEGSEYAGSVSFSDAHMVVFPVRTIKHTFAYVTCPTALGRMKRILELAELGNTLQWTIPEFDDKPDGGEKLRCFVASPRLLHTRADVLLETYEFKVSGEKSTPQIADWLANNAVPGSKFEYFTEKLKKDLVIVPDRYFDYFVKNCTVVETHVRIDDVSRTAEEGGLFTTENLPPECLLVCLMLTSKERKANRAENSNSKPWKAEQVASKLINQFHERMIQIGGDSTTGRGLVVPKFYPYNPNKK